MASSKKVGVKLTVDKEKRRVVLAESGKEFVDILFSFLTMPLGTVIRLLRNKSPSWLGSLVNLYESVANLGTSCFWTDACKTMLLRPRNSAEVKCEDLAVNIDDTEPRTVFTCKGCILYSYFYSSVPDTRCRCGRLMSQANKWKRKDRKAHGDGVFVNGEMRFFITDDLNVSPASAANLFRTIKNLEMEDAGKLEERRLDLGPEEIANLLWRTLISTTPLTDLCFNTPGRPHVKHDDVIQPKHERESSDVHCNSKEIKLKLVLHEESNKLLFAEADEDMVDLLFSWLTFPLGLLAKHAKDMPHGCIGNLSKCLECHGLVKSEECKLMLLSPKLAPFHGCNNQLLNAEEMVSETRHIPGYTTEDVEFSKATGSYCTMPAKMEQVNPRSLTNGTEVGGGYARAFRKYMVTDDLRVLPLSLQSIVQILGEFSGTEVGGGYARAFKKYMVTDDLRVLPLSLQSIAQILGAFRIPASSFVEREVGLGVTQASNLLRAAFVSRTALSDVFPLDVFPLRKKHKRLPDYVVK